MCIASYEQLARGILRPVSDRRLGLVAKPNPNCQMRRYSAAAAAVAR